MDPDALDARYPLGSRVVLVVPPFDAARVRVLSRDLVSAGAPAVSPDGRRVLLVGKAAPQDQWQIYEVRLPAGNPRRITSADGGASDPALLAEGSVVFSSPVPKAAEVWVASRPPALYAQSPGGRSTRRLTFGLAGVADPTVLSDGRILFVSAMPARESSPAVRLALFTVNSDGTGISAFGCQHEGAAGVRRPREVPGGRIVFVGSEKQSARIEGWAEELLSGRPFLSRGPLRPAPRGSCCSVEPAGAGELLASLERREPEGDGLSSYAIFRIDVNSGVSETPLFDDPAWHDIEATPAAPRPRPKGHLSTVDPARTTGLLLCLDVNESTVRTPQTGNADAQILAATRAGGTGDTADPPAAMDPPQPAPVTAAAHIRVLTQGDGGTTQAIGEAAVREDGSFLVEVPADVPIGFQTLDGEGRILRELPPTIWVRPGEVRSCIGCHEPHGRAPRNRRPLAVKGPPVRIGEALGTAARSTRP